MNTSSAPVATATAPALSTAQLTVAQPTKQQLIDYANSLLVVNNYAYAITNQLLPVLNYPPADYGNFTASFAPAKQHALDWSSNIFVSIVQLPATIVNQASNLFNMEELMINAYLGMLIADPTNQEAKTQLASALSTVSQLIQTQVTTITGIQSQLNAFSTNIQNDAKTLTQISADATADAGSDQTQINTINANIGTLNSEISTAQTLLNVSEAGILLSMYIGMIGAVCCLLPGAQGVGVGLLVVAVAGEAGSIAGTIIESESISAMQAQILSDQSQINGLNQDIILLNGVASQFNQLYETNLKAQTALATILSMWQQLDEAVSNVSTELTDMNNDLTAAHYQQAQADFAQAEANWNDLVSFAQALAGISYNWQDTNGVWHDYGTQSPSINSGNVTPLTSQTPAQPAVAA